MYYFVNPKNKELREGSPDHVDWEFANKEICQAKGFSIGGGAELSKGKAHQFHSQKFNLT